MAGLRLDRKVRVMRAPVVDDGFQGRRGAPALLGEAWAALSQPAVGEGQVQGQDAATLAVTLTVRAQGVGLQIGAADLVECDGATWEVVGIMPVVDRRWRSFRVVSRVAA